MNTPALSKLLEHAADAVAAVRGGRSLSDVLPRVPELLRPGVQALVFQVLRRLGSATELRALLAPRAPPPAVEALLLVALALLWPPEEGEVAPYADHTLVDQAVAATHQRTPAAAGFVNAVLRRFVRERSKWVAAAQRTALGAYNHPAWWVERVRQDWPGHWQALLAQANRRAPMTLRVNARRGTAARYLERLAHHGIAARLQVLPGPWGRHADHERGASGRAGGLEATAAAAGIGSAGLAGPAEPAVVLLQPCPVGQLPGFAAGEVSVQDAAAQAAAPLLLGDGSSLARLPPGARVLDACAAPGGKTAHLLELADLELVALDADAQRLARVHENLRRLKLDAAPCLEVLAADARQPTQWWDGRPFDAVLLDAPCTASGIVRRHPDVRWLRRPADIDALAATQAHLLEALWPLVAPGGRLLYATCSIFKAEGQRQIDAFLQRHGPAAARLWGSSPGHLLPLADNEMHGRAAEAAGAAGAVRAAARDPAAAHDGFFYALIEKT